MVRKEDDELFKELPGKFRSKMKKREKKRKPKMKISGRGIFQLKKIFRKKR